MEFPVHKVLLATIWGIINMAWCINPGEMNLSPLWQHVGEIDTLCQSVFTFLLFLLTLSLSLTLSVSVPVFFHTLSLSLSLSALTLSSSPLGIGDVTAGSACPPLRQQQSPVALTNLI